MTDRHILTLLGPILLKQGKALRRKLTVLPEPAGDREGVSGKGEPVRLLILGDSSAAGVGADTQDDALLGRLVKLLAADHRVEYKLVARSGATTAYTLACLEAMDPEPYDWAVTSLGGNDATKLTEPKDFQKQQLNLLTMLKERFGVSRVIVTGLPPMHLFTAMPQPLRWVIGRRARQLNKALRDGLIGHPFAEHLDTKFGREKALLATDEFHPGPKAYELWAEHVAAALKM